MNTLLVFYMYCSYVVISKMARPNAMNISPHFPQL